MITEVPLPSLAHRFAWQEKDKEKDYRDPEVVEQLFRSARPICSHLWQALRCDEIDCVEPLDHIGRYSMYGQIIEQLASVHQLSLLFARTMLLPFLDADDLSVSARSMIEQRSELLYSLVDPVAFTAAPVLTIDTHHDPVHVQCKRLKRNISLHCLYAVKPFLASLLAFQEHNFVQPVYRRRSAAVFKFGRVVWPADWNDDRLQLRFEINHVVELQPVAEWPSKTLFPWGLFRLLQDVPFWLRPPLTFEQGFLIRKTVGMAPCNYKGVIKDEKAGETTDTEPMKHVFVVTFADMTLQVWEVQHAS